MSNRQHNTDLLALAPIVKRFRGRRILLVGDLGADHYIYGRTARISREAPVLILKHQTEYVLPGQAANTANNIVALGGRATAVGIVGKDNTGKALKAVMRKLRIATDSIIEAPGAATLTKTRILAGGHHTCRQQVIRIDNDEKLVVDAKTRKQAISLIRQSANTVDAVLVSDYGYGFVDEGLWAEALRIKTRRGVPLLLDSRYQLSRLKGATLVTPNEGEALETCGMSTDTAYDIDEVGNELLRRTGAEGVLITRGNEGMALYRKKQKTFALPIFGTDQVTDVTGAGDTVVASAGLSLAAGATMEQAAQIANVAGGIVVMKMGTATVSAEEILAAIKEGCPPVLLA